MEPTTSLLLVLGVVLCLVFLKRKIYSTGSTNIPGPRAWPLIGNALSFIKVKCYEDAVRLLEDIARSFDSPMCRIWLGPKLTVVVRDPKYIEVLMNNRGLADKEDFFYQGHREGAGPGIFTRARSEGWSKLRKPLSGLVMPKNISSFQEVICLKIDELLISKLDKHVDKEAYDIDLLLKGFGLEILLMLTLGIESVYSLKEDPFQFMSLVDREVEEMFAMMFKTKNILKLKRYSVSAIDRGPLHQLSWKIIHELKSRLKEQGRDFTEGPPKNYGEVIFRFVKDGEADESELGPILNDYLVAGADTLSITSGATLLFLAMHQDCQAKAVQELYSIFGDSTRDADENDLKRMVYLEMCLKESLRFCSPPAVARKADEDIEIDGYHIPRGAAVGFVFTFSLNDPKYWERPGEYYPEHFLPESVSKRPRGSFLPFASGPRDCPGQAYSFQAMKTIVSTLLRRYHVTTDVKFHELKYKYVLMREVIKPLVKFTRRTWDD